MKRRNLRSEIVQYMKGKAYRPLTDRELAAALDVQKPDRKRFDSQLKSLETAGHIIRTRTGRYALPELLNLVVGKISATATGNAFVDADDSAASVFIGPDGVGPAIDGDRVLARVHRQATADKRAEGVIVRVIEPRTTPVVGTYRRGAKSGFIVPDRTLLRDTVVISPGDEAGASPGDKVVVELTARTAALPEGRVIEVLGAAGDPGVDITAIVRRLGLPEQFPANVLEAANKLPDVTDADIAGRLDLRQLLTVTIDGDDAKDHDDAISLQIEADRRILGVHIADVSHYVKPRTPLDSESKTRATSVYLVDRTIHMVPPSLSQGLASLQEGKDRLAVSAFMEFDRASELISYRFARSVINVRHRLTYNMVNASMDGDPNAVPAAVFATLTSMAELAAELSEHRRTRGAVDMDLPEPEITLDDQGHAIDVGPRPRGIGERLIEQFMLAANEAVADYLSRERVPGVYRVHEPPSEDAVESLARTLAPLGFKLKSSVRRPATFQKLLKQVAGRPEERLVSTLVLRAMQKARYSPDNLGHFGLASPAYTHFTSPIRRYPDLLVHRLLLRSLGNKVTDRFREAQAELLPPLCDHCSAMERRADEAEREADKLKILEYMAGRLGEQFSGLISGVAPYGFYVGLDNTAEGFVHVSTLVDDFYDYDEDRAALIGRRKNRRFRLGDRVTVWAHEIDPTRRELGLRLSD